MWGGHREKKRGAPPPRPAPRAPRLESVRDAGGPRLEPEADGVLGDPPGFYRMTHGVTPHGYGRMPCADGPGVRSGAARVAHSQRSGGVSGGSTISSIQKGSAERKGRASVFRRPSLSGIL